ncbi:MAG: LytTR family DNA-binding domain-containing protein [Saprospiraceae bacterium]
MMQKIKSLIVDDEQDSRESLFHFLTKYCPEIEVIGSSTNIQEARQAIGIHQPKLLFLDIEMPYGNAFDLLEQLPEVDFEIVFITAFSQYAVQAFNLSAAHYLLKPIDIDELVTAVEKVKNRLQKIHTLNSANILKENLSYLQSQHQKVVLPLLDGFEVVRMAEILYCEADENFTHFYFTNGKKSLICRKLKFFDQLLSLHGFCRIHRSYLINMEYVQRYVKGKGGTVVLENGQQLQVANARKNEFLERFI